MFLLIVIGPNVPSLVSRYRERGVKALIIPVLAERSPINEDILLRRNNSYSRIVINKESRCRISIFL